MRRGNGDGRLVGHRGRYVGRLRFQTRLSLKRWLLPLLILLPLEWIEAQREWPSDSGPYAPITASAPFPAFSPLTETDNPLDLPETLPEETFTHPTTFFNQSTDLSPTYLPRGGATNRSPELWTSKTTGASAQLNSTTLTFPAAPLSSPLEELARFSENNRPPILRLPGGVLYQLGLLSSLVSDSNPQLRHSGKKADLELSLGPAIRLSKGEAETGQILGGYALSLNRLLLNPEPNRLNQEGLLRIRAEGERLKISLEGLHDIASEGSRDTASRVKIRNLSTRGDVRYLLTEKVSAELDASFYKSGYDSFAGSRDYRAAGFLNYQFSPKLLLGAGAAQGRLLPESSSAQQYTQALAKASWQPREKLRIDASGGAEWRQIPGQASSNAPVFQLSSLWQAREQTALQLDLERRIFSSAALTGQNFESTALRLTLRQQLSHSLSSDLSLGYEKADYQPNTQTSGSSRRDHFYSGKAGVRWQISQLLQAGVFYEHTANVSSESESFSFRRDRIGLSLNLAF